MSQSIFTTSGGIEIPIRVVDESTATIRGIATDLAILGSAAMGVARLGQAFGVLSSEASEAISLLGSTISVGASVIRVIETLTTSTTLATVAQWAHNASLAMKISLLTLGLGLIAATAGYMGWLAATTREAASAQGALNAEMGAFGGGRQVQHDITYYRKGDED